MSGQPVKSTPFNWLAVASLLLITILYALYFTQSVIMVDTARDLFKAGEITQGGQWPMLGPDIGGFFHTGPLWFYFLAIPALSGSLVFVAFWVGIFAGLKFVLAYQLGSALISKNFGLMWAFMLLLPGWHVINQLSISHINLVETLALFLLLMLYRFSRTGLSKYWMLSALAMGVGFHAHPSFLVLAVFFLPAMKQQRKHLSLKSLVLASALFLLPLLPFIIDQLIHGFPDYDRWVARNEGSDQIRATGKAVSDVSWWQHYIKNLFAILVEGPARILEFVHTHVPNLGLYMKYFYFTVMLTIGFGCLMMFKSPKLRKWFLMTFLGLMLILLLVTLMRSFTPFYMLLTLTPILSGLFALAAYALLKDFTAGRLACMFLLFCLGFIPYFAFHKAAKHHQINLGPVMNITQELPDNWMDSPETLDAMTVLESKKLSAFFCDKTTVVNGPFIPVLDFTSGATLQFYCAASQVHLGGTHNNPDQVLFLMHKSFWDAIDRPPDQWLSPSWGLSQSHQNHAPDMNFSLQPFDDYVHPPRSNTQLGPKQEKEVVINTQNAPYLIVSNTLPANMRFAVSNITANGLPVTLVVVNAANRMYHCQSCNQQKVSWQFTLTANDFSAIDINTLPQ